MLELNHDTFTDLIHGETPALVDFWAPWCMPCKVFAPVLEELSDELDGRVAFGKLNIDDFADVATEYGITSIPTVILFKNGRPAAQMVGVRPKDDVLKTIEQSI